MSDDDTRHDELTDAMVTRFVEVLQEFLSDESEAEKSGGFARLGKHVLAAAISAGLTLAATTAGADLAKEEDKNSLAGRSHLRTVQGFPQDRIRGPNART